MPQKLLGMRIEPPPWVPMANGPMRVATAAPAPPLEPPGVRSRCHGLREMPVTGLSVTPLKPNSGVVVLPSMTAPAALRRSTTGASSDGTSSAYSFEPRIVRTPLVITRSLIDTGTPCSGPSASPRITARSAACAACRAASAVNKQKAFSVGLSRSMRSRTAFTTSTGETFLVRIAAARSVAETKQRSVSLMRFPSTTPECCAMPWQAAPYTPPPGDQAPARCDAYQPRESARLTLRNLDLTHRDPLEPGHERVRARVGS